VKKLEKYKCKDKDNVNKLQILWDEELDIIHAELAADGIDIFNLKTPLYGWLYYACLFYFYAYNIYQWTKCPSYQNGAFVGIFGWLLCGIIQHDASHYALSKRPIINRLFSYCLIPYSNPTDWYRKHCILHHQYTNTLLDEDFQSTDEGLVRHHRDVKWNKFQTLQLVTIELYSAFVVFFYSFGLNVNTFCQIMIISSHYYLHKNILLSYSPFAAFSLLFLFFTQLNHIQESAVSSKLLKQPQNFVKHQIQSCVDYSHNNILLSGLSILLNYQTYHHLFPSVSHLHFWWLAPRINRILARHNYYIVNHSFKDVVYNYFSYMQMLSYKNDE
jgi:linoleoyl-CoA desaturase